MLFQENEVLSSISSFLLSNPDCVRRAADWEQRQKIKKGYQWVTFFEWNRSLFLDLLPCPWKRHRKRKQWIKVKRMVMLTITSVFPFRPCVWDNLSMWEFLGYFSEGKGFVSVPCGFLCHVYNDKLNRARGQVWEVAHDQLEYLNACVLHGGVGTLELPVDVNGGFGELCEPWGTAPHSRMDEK